MFGLKNHSLPIAVILVVGAAALILIAPPRAAQAKQEYRTAFYAAYPDAVGTVIETVPSQTNHCGICHYRFTGGGTRNPYGARVEITLPNFPNTTEGRIQAILSIAGLDSDGDGFTQGLEITDRLQYSNTPTFPGLTPSNVGQVTNVNIADIQDYLVPTQGGDTTPPTVTVLSPNGGETLTANQGTLVTWTATDESGVAGISLFVSLDDGLSYDPVALNIPNSGSFNWFPANRPTTTAWFLVQAVDNAFNYGQDTTNATFTIVSPPGGRVPTTLRDFDLPGTQPFEAGMLNPPEACAVCHGGYDPAVEPYFNWEGSMMAHASRDLLMEASLVIANQDAPDSGDLCLRCHLTRGWLQGRSVPTDGSQMLASDGIGVACDFCHRLVDPIPAPENPAEDAAILAALENPPSVFSVGQFVVDPTGARRGPFADATSGHPILVSPFHREAALCGTCHDVSNPAFEKDAFGNYVPNAFDAPALDFASDVIAPVERTYSEWFFSEYNTPSGIYAPQFGGNLAYVATCQDCHLRDVTGQGCNSNPPIRTNLPLHDMTGGSTWYPSLLPTLFPDEVNPTAIQAGIERARYMLQNAAELATTQVGRTLRVTVTNNTGHKLPTGYPEGRRIWINVQFYDDQALLIGESGAYDPATGVLSHDDEVKIYEIEPVTSGIPGLPDGTLFHFVLNNAVHKDNRIPPRGFTNANYAAFGGPPVDYAYADGQYWDDTYYAIPREAASVAVTLYYQSTSKEFVEFLRDENVTNTKGQELYDLWNNNGKCPPEPMVSTQLALAPPLLGDLNEDGYVDMLDVELFAPCLTGPELDFLTGCELSDLDTDDDVDLLDLADFQTAFTGPDALAPAAPTGLHALAGDAVVTLTWSPNTEPDLAGYNVYRAEVSGGPYGLLNPTPLASPAYTDTAVVNQTTYYYVVTAVDEHQNESAPSDESGATPTSVAFMHVESIVPSILDLGGGQKYGLATVTILDAGGTPVYNAEVTGTFTGDFIGTRSATTGLDGVAVLQIGPKGGRTNFQFCVDNVTHALNTYDPAANVETCDVYP